jgi:hypothetical protein
MKATLDGCHAAIVTSEGHPHDWATVALSRISQQSVINGKKFMFITDSQKRWDLALARLVE